jgi:hypothetical protein
MPLAAVADAREGHWTTTAAWKGPYRWWCRRCSRYTQYSSEVLLFPHSKSQRGGTFLSYPDGRVRPVLTTAAGRERPLSGRPAMFGRASSMGLPTDPCDFLPKDFW